MREHRTRSRSRSVLRALLIALVPLAGCSFVVMRGPRSGYEPAQGPPACTETRIIPGFDGIGAATGATVAGMVFLVESLASVGGGDCLIYGVCAGTNAAHGLSATIGVASAALALSSLYGLSKSQECHRAYDSYRASVSPAPIAPASAPVHP
jgi:hypothetical protein